MDYRIFVFTVLLIVSYSSISVINAQTYGNEIFTLEQLYGNCNEMSQSEVDENNKRANKKGWNRYLSGYYCGNEIVFIQILNTKLHDNISLSKFEKMIKSAAEQKNVKVEVQLINGLTEHLKSKTNINNNIDLTSYQYLSIAGIIVIKQYHNKNIQANNPFNVTINSDYIGKPKYSFLNDMDWSKIALSMLPSPSIKIKTKRH